jgi:hypothetical protein
MTVEMGIFKKEALKREEAERQERLSRTAYVEAVYPLGCYLEDLRRFAREVKIPLLEVPRWRKGKRTSSMLVLCPEMSAGENGREGLFRETFSQLSCNGIWPERKILRNTCLLVGRREVVLYGGATYCGRDAMKPPGAESVLNGWQLAYYLPPQNGHSVRVGIVTGERFLRDGPPFLSDQRWQSFSSKVESSLNELGARLAWTDAARGNDYL